MSPDEKARPILLSGLVCWSHGERCSWSEGSTTTWVFGEPDGWYRSDRQEIPNFRGCALVVATIVLYRAAGGM